MFLSVTFGGIGCDFLCNILNFNQLEFYTENQNDFVTGSHYLLLFLQGINVKDKKPKQCTSGIGTWQCTPYMLLYGFLIIIQ